MIQTEFHQCDVQSIHKKRTEESRSKTGLDLEGKGKKNVPDLS